MPNKKESKKGKRQGVGEEEPMSLRDNAVHPTCVISEEDIQETAVIGQGFYATVKFGLWTRPNKKEPTKVAIKCIKEEMVQDHLAEILMEANNMVKLEHDNIIKLFGICLIAKEDQPCKVKLVTEYASYGCLISVIQDQDEEHRSFFCQVTKLWEFACQIAKGMQYLHNKNMIHFDLAARNVLVVTADKVRISDFGLAKVLCPYQNKTSLEKPLALAWCAPELIKKQVAGFATKGCDVWSFGVLLWELMSFGEQPWAGLSHQEIMEQADNPHKRLVQPLACSDAIFDVMQECWSQEPGERPSFTRIIELLKKAKPIVAAAKNGCWTARERELCFQPRTKLTIIVSFGTGKYRCQNDKAKVGLVSEENIDFKATPLEITLSKLKISYPFDMRHTTKEEILKEHNSTGVFPVEVEKLVQLAEPKLYPSQAQPQDEAAVQEDYYTAMSGQCQDVEDSAKQEVKPSINRDEPPIRQPVPPPIPERLDLPSSHFSTLPTRRRPVPTPRKPRPKSTDDGRDTDLEWVIPIDKRPDDDLESASKIVKSKDEDALGPQHKEGNLFECPLGVNGHGLTRTEITPETETRHEQANDEAADLISFDQKTEHKNPTTLAESKRHPENGDGLFIDLSTGLDVEGQEKTEACDDLPASPHGKTPEETPVQKGDHPHVEEGFLIDLDENTKNQQEKAKDNDGDVPPPLPPKDFLSRRSGMPGPLLPPLVQLPATSPAMQIGSIGYSTLTHPSSHHKSRVSSSERPRDIRPSSTPLPELPERDYSFDDSSIPTRPTETNAKPRSKSESESSTAYGEEINEEIAKIQAEFPDTSKDACYAIILEYKGDIGRILKVLQVSRFTSVSEKEADYHLGHCNWNVERTVNYVLDKSK